MMLMFMEEDEFPVPETEEASVEVTSEPLYCICQEPWDKHNRRFMIECNYCKDWFHGSCVGLQEHESQDIEKYHCPKCVKFAGPSQNKVFVNYHRHDYSDKTAQGKPIQAGTKVFISKLQEKSFPSSDEIILKMRGNTLTLPYLMKCGFTRPILVENTDGLDLRIPRDNFSVKDVEKYVGPDRILDVIDVQRQNEIKMTMKEFADYFTTPNRTKLYNLISLEFSKTQLSRLVEAPYIARKLDWVATCWPKGLDEEVAHRPEVSKYCLISTKDSYTDFHIDFGGTSVWYHILWGEKVFYLIEPTAANLALYARWMASVDQYESFFADSVDHCYKCVLKKGETLFIPTGWIHAVFTPQDSLVFGGNFLHSLNMDLQLQVYEIEKKLNVPAKYLFPSFESTHWFAATHSVIDHLQSLNKIGNVPPHVLTGSKSLLRSLKLWSSEKLIAGPSSVGKYRCEFIPPNINPSRLLKDLSREIRAVERRVSSSKPSKADDKPSGIKTCGGVIKKQSGVESEDENKSESCNTSINSESNLSTIPSNNEKKPRVVEKESKKSKHSHHRHHKKSSGSSESQHKTPKQQVTPIKLKISVTNSASSSPQYMSSPRNSDHAFSPSYSTTNGNQANQNSTYSHQTTLNSNTKLSSLNSYSMTPYHETSSSSSFQSPKHQNGEEDGFKTDGSNSRDQLPKLRLSLSAKEKRVKIIDDSDIQDSDNNLYIDSDHDNLKIDTDDEQKLVVNSNKSSRSRSKCKKHRKNKCHKKNERNITIDKVLAGTLESMNDLFTSSNYHERINAFTKDSSPMVKESFQDMLSMGGEKGRKRKFNSSQAGFDAFESIEKVHQDDDFIYLPLTADDDDERDSKRSRKTRDDDEQWSPRGKVGRLMPREQLRNPSRKHAKRQHVEKGLEAAAKLASLSHKPVKRKYKTQKKEGNSDKASSVASAKPIQPSTSRVEPLSSSSKNISSISKLPTSKSAAPKQSSYRFFDSTGKVKVLKSSRGIRDACLRLLHKKK